MRPTLRAPGYDSLKQENDKLLSNLGFNFNLRRYTMGSAMGGADLSGVGVGRCRLTASKPVLKAPLLSALEAEIWTNRFQALLSTATCAATSGACGSRSSSTPRRC